MRYELYKFQGLQISSEFKRTFQIMDLQTQRSYFFIKDIWRELSRENMYSWKRIKCMDNFEKLIQYCYENYFELFL